MPKFINTFTGGMDRDTAPTSYKNTNYYNARNFSIVVAEDLSSATLTNTKGVSVVLSCRSTLYGHSLRIVGITDVNATSSTGVKTSNLIVFIQGTPGVENDSIHEIPYSTLESGSILDLYNTTTYRMVSAALGLGSRVEVIAREETPSIRKIYWVDGVNPLRYCNLALGKTVLSGYTISQFEVYQNVTLTTPTYNALISGTLKCGMYQYTYCLYNQNGGQTAYAPPSKFIQVGSTDTSTLPVYFNGGDISEVSSNGIQVAIANSSTTYSYIRVVAMYYSSPDASPECTIIYEGLKRSSMVVTHTGSELLGTLSIEDVIATPNILIPKTITSKFNYLFLGNTIESRFDVDFDARAYRYFSGTNYFVLYDSDTTYGDPSHVINYVYPNFPAITNYTYTISPKNILNWDSSGNTNANRQSNGSTIGGTGPKTWYNFITRNITYKEESSGLGIWRNPDGYANPANNSYVGYQRDEVYRFGIVFFNKKGQQSFVKWINDIRFPRMSDSGFDIRVSSTQFRALGIHFDFNFTGIDADIDSYQIVRAEREYSNATVVDCGYVGNLYSGGGSTISFGQAYLTSPSTTEFQKPGIDPSGATTYRYLLEYICPETNYNKNNYAPQERLDVYAGNSTSVRKTTSTNKNNAVVTSVNPVGTFNSYKNITDAVLFQKQDSLTATQSFKGFTIRTRSTSANSGSRGYKGSTLLLHLDSDLLPTSGHSNYPHYVLRRRTTYPYGGYTESALNNTTYYPCSPVTPIATTSIDVWGGDTYITNFEYMRVLWADATSGMTSDRYVQIVQCLVESKLNLDYTINNRWSKYDDNTQISTEIMVTGYEYMGMQEVAGVYPFYLNGSPALYFTQEKDLYTYNPVYSVTTGSKSYFPKPTNFTENTIYPTRVYKSLVKINGETTDSWLQFLANNYKDIDGQFGNLTRLYNHNNTIFYFQDKAFGIIPVNDREVISTSTGASTVIGTGGVLERFDYVSTNVGTTLPGSIVGTDSNLYFVDSSLKKICMWNGDEGVTYISDTNGMLSYMSSATLTTVNSTYNPKSKEIYFSFPTEMLVWNEYTKSFVGFSDSVMEYGIYNNGRMYGFNSTLDYESTTKYNIVGVTMGTGNYGYYKLENTYFPYAPTKYNSTLELIINPARNIVSRFDILEMATEVYDTSLSTNIVDATFTTLRVTNNYQDTGIITLTSGTNIVRKFRAWRYNQLRDTLDTTSTGRLIDNYAKVSLVFSPTSAGKLTVNDITTTFTPLNINRNS